MQLRRAFALALFATFSSASLSAQSLNLRDLLTDFFRNGITLADPPAGSPFPTHAHHFVGDASLVPLEELNNELAAQLSTFPLASSAGGFTYRYDPALGDLHARLGQLRADLRGTRRHDRKRKVQLRPELQPFHV